MRRISVAERRARLGLRHRLAGGALAGDAAEAARSLVAVHSTDPSSVYLALLARMTGGGTEDVSRALYADKTLIRLLGMRRTVFVATLEVAPVIQAACSRAVAVNERRKLLGLLAESGIEGDVAGWLAGAEEAALRALAARGEATAAELATDDPRLQVQITLSRGKPYEGRQNVASRVLFLLAAEGRVVRGRPRGSWTSHQYRWAPLAPWCPQGLDGWTAGAAEVELARRWLAAYGPATPEDLRWWAGWTKTQVRRALAALKPAEVDLDGVPGVALPGDLEPPPPVQPWAALLPALDSTPMGWQQRDWFLGEHASRLSACGVLDLDALARHWSGILRVVASIHTGEISADDVIRIRAGGVGVLPNVQRQLRETCRAFGPEGLTLRGGRAIPACQAGRAARTG